MITSTASARSAPEDFCKFSKTLLLLEPWKSKNNEKTILTKPILMTKLMNKLFLFVSNDDDDDERYLNIDFVPI